MENQELERLYMNQMTCDKMYDLFGIEEIDDVEELAVWLKNIVELTESEINMVKYHQSILLKNISDWNEQELSLGFIGPIINLVDFKVKYKLGFYAQRPLSAFIKTERKEYELIGKPDGIVASGGAQPKMPYFSFHEYKKDVDSSGDPAGQNLAAMLVGQALNENDNVIYGCYVVGRNWYFMVLKGKEYAISKSYSADDDEILEIVRILKTLRSILFKKLGIEEVE